MVCVLVYTPKVYIDPKVQPPLFKQDMTKTPQKLQNRPKRHYKCLFKLKNTLKASITIDIWLGKDIGADLSPMLQGNTLQSKAGWLVGAALK